MVNAEVNGLHAEGFGSSDHDRDWVAQLDLNSLGWVCARRRAQLVGFLNVAWDGGSHAFILDTVVASCAARRGIGTQLVAIATREARLAGCEWLHVDFEENLRAFYVGACGFSDTGAGLIRL
ncbi:MAG: GNAT family N-acetyltransferase [Actinomycetota bacterium]|nr:GNAT family N-acetyltransferase [Actinomycetota bacterium]